MAMMTRPSLAFAVVDGVLLIAHSTESPTDDDWDRLVTTSLELHRMTPMGRTLVTSEGGAPTAMQRHRMDRRIRDNVAALGVPRARIAIMSHSPFVRAVVTASTLLEEGWFARATRGMRGANESSQVYRAFLPREMVKALAWLDVPAGKETHIMRELARLKNAVGETAGPS